jgi:acyl-coenzyme A thioesterase 9
MRIGLLLEDLDSFAAEIAYAHADGFARNLTIVTASLDRLELKSPMSMTEDVTLEGMVTYVGTSSMEVRVDVLQGSATKMSCLFTMVARSQGHAAAVAPLVCRTKAERQRFEQGIVNKIRRMEFAKTSLTVAPPTSEEKELVHWLFMNSRQRKPDTEVVPMKSTSITSSKIMHPQSRNIHGKIFGGYLMRQAYETAFIASTAFCNQRPSFIALDDNTFLRPVEVGSIMQFIGTVVYQNPSSHVIRVVVKEMLSGETTNVFHFTFTNPDRQTKRVLIPETLEEANLYIEGKRIHRKGEQLGSDTLHSTIRSEGAQRSKL